MSYLIAALLGLVQGITEFLPVSSSGHLALLQNFFHIEEADLVFDALLHLGTLLAVFAALGTEVRGLLRGGLAMVGVGRYAKSRKPAARAYKRLALLILLASVPLVLVLPFWGKLNTSTVSPVFVGIMLLINGGILYVSGRNSGNGKAFRNVTPLDAILVGLGQILGAVPGISRSGCVISAGTMRGFQGSFAVKFSLLLSIPSVVGSVIVSMISAFRLGFDAGMLPVYLTGMLTAAVSGYFAIRLLRWIAVRGKMGNCAYYCWGAGIVALMLSLIA